MRVAICLSGHMREFRECAATLKRYVLDVPGNDCDVFIHTWDKLGWYSPNDSASVARSTHDVEKEIRRLYNPIKFVIEPTKEFNVDSYCIPQRRPNVKKGTRGEHILGMYYKIKMANLLKREHEAATRKVYDVVVRSRPDVYHYAPQPFEMELTGRSVYVDIPGQYGGVNDQFAIGNSYNMDTYALCYDHIPTYIKKGCQWRPEPILLYHLRNFGVQIRAKHMNYHLLRPNGELFKNSGTFRLGR